MQYDKNFFDEMETVFLHGIPLSVTTTSDFFTSNPPSHLPSTTNTSPPICGPFLISMLVITGLIDTVGADSFLLQQYQSLHRLTDLPAGGEVHLTKLSLIQTVFLHGFTNRTDRLQKFVPNHFPR